VSFRLLTPTAGWALTADALLTTADRGAHWSDVTPFQARPAVGVGQDGIKGVDFTDPLDGWVTLARTSQSSWSATVTILHTTDGGRHWQRRGNVTVALQYCMCSATVDAIDSLHVWDDIDVGTKADGWGRSVLYRSTDGGWTWQQVALPSSGQVLFSDPLDGVIAGGSPSIFDAGTGVPHSASPFYATMDGGLHWTPPIFTSGPPPTPSPTSDNPYANYTAFKGFAVAYIQNTISASNVYVYSTFAGSSWTPRNTITAQDFPVLTIVTPTSWFLSDLDPSTNQPRLESTGNAGATWRSVSPVPSPYPANASWAFSFADPINGWAYTSTS
jgi:hypothetical protein